METLIVSALLAAGAAIRHFLPIALAAAGRAMLDDVRSTPAPSGPAPVSSHPVLDELLKLVLNGKLNVQPVNGPPVAVPVAAS